MAFDPPEGERILFVSRKYPPSVGGMERLAELIYHSLQERVDTQRIALGRSQRNLWWFLPVTAVRTAWAVLRGRCTRVVCDDPVVLGALLPVCWLGRPRIDVFVHGLDLTLPNRLYRRYVQAALCRADRVIAISRATMEEARKLGVPDDRLAVVPPGEPAPPWQPGVNAQARAEILRQLDLPPDAVVLTTVGRLVRRKGVRWFVSEVLPRLPAEIHYVVAGTGPELEAVEEAAAMHGADRAHVLGLIDDHRRDLLLYGSDAFVMPNLHVPGDLEGFGLVAIEAALRGTPVIAADLEGIRDAIADGSTGWFCPSEDVDAFVTRITELATAAGRRDWDERTRVREEAVTRFSRERMAAQLDEVLCLTPADGDPAPVG